VQRTNKPVTITSINQWPGVLTGMIKTPANKKNPMHYMR
jgi:hypothetical protein